MAPIDRTAVTATATAQPRHAVTRLLTAASSISIHCISQAALVMGLSLSAPSVMAETTIMAIGGWRTQGANGFASYRYPLWYLLQDAGYDVDMVGTQRFALFNAIPPSSRYPRYETDFDRDHEGWGQSSADEVVAGASPAIAALAPDVALILVGGTDLYELGPSGITHTATWAQIAIDQLRAANPNVQVLLSGMHPAKFSQAGLIPNLNDSLEALAASTSTAGSRVLYVDQFTNFDVNELVDATHVPNVAGEIEMADRFFAVLETVLPEPGPVDEFTINAGLNDAWYLPATSGQGFFVNVFPDVELIFLGWFTYDTSLPGGAATVGAPEHRWLTALGGWEGNVATLDVTLTSGGVFDDPTPVSNSEAGTYGTVTVEFHNCASATVTYDLFALGISGVIPIQRIVPDNNTLCEALQE